MPKPHEHLVENAVSAALAAIEVYNKPAFRYREQVFCILITNAWELLLKAKLLRDAGDDLDAVSALDKSGNPKHSRSGNRMTIDVLHAASKAGVDVAIRENLSLLVEIRDTATHLYHAQPIGYLVYTLGVAALRNFQQLADKWFGRSLQEYSFYILPVAFTYNFKTLSVLELEEHPDEIANIIRSASATQEQIERGGDFYFICEVGTEIKSAKKIVGEPHFHTAIDPAADPDATVVVRFQQVIDKYPLAYKDVWNMVKAALLKVKQNQFNRAIKGLGIKNNREYAYYIFNNKKQEEEFHKSGKRPKVCLSVYNEDAVRVLVETLRKELDARLVAN